MARLVGHDVVNAVSPHTATRINKDVDVIAFLCHPEEKQTTRQKKEAETNHQSRRVLHRKKVHFSLRQYLSLLHLTIAWLLNVGFELIVSWVIIKWIINISEVNGSQTFTVCRFNY